MLKTVAISAAAALLVFTLANRVTAISDFIWPPTG